jgi:hypothetical protein
MVKEAAAVLKRTEGKGNTLYRQQDVRPMFAIDDTDDVTDNPTASDPTEIDRHAPGGR